MAFCIGPVWKYTQSRSSFSSRPAKSVTTRSTSDLVPAFQSSPSGRCVGSGSVERALMPRLDDQLGAGHLLKSVDQLERVRAKVEEDPLVAGQQIASAADPLDVDEVKQLPSFVVVSVTSRSRDLATM